MGDRQASARLDAEVLLAHVLGVGRSYLYTWPDRVLEPARVDAFRALLARRVEGHPIAYLTGLREFYGIELHVDEHTLIPRPETEGLVDLALAQLPPRSRKRVADLGTGSGAVAIAIAAQRPDCEVLATDTSPGALAVARRNAQRMHLDNIQFARASWCEALQGGFDLIVSNPPYVADDDPHLDEGDVRFEPRSALAAGPRGMDAVRQLAACTAAHLVPGGWLVLEHGLDQGDLTRECLALNGFVACTTLPDLSGHDRYSMGRRPGAR